MTRATTEHRQGERERIPGSLVSGFGGYPEALLAAVAHRTAVAEGSFVAALAAEDGPVWRRLRTEEALNSCRLTLQNSTPQDTPASKTDNGNMHSRPHTAATHV